MGKMTTYLILVYGILILSFFAGLIPSPESILSYLLNNQGNATTFITDHIWAWFILFIVAVVGASVTIAGFSAGGFRPDIVGMYALLGFMGLSLLYGITGIWTLIASNINWFVATIIISPILILTFIILIDWARGIDS